MTTNQIFRTGQSSKFPTGQRMFLSGFLENISLASKMILMLFVLFLGTLGVAVAAYNGLQSMRYQLSNIYDFMLIPIVSINHADTALADAKFLFENLTETAVEEQSKNLNAIQAANKLAEETIARYDTEWVTTISPEFTQSLRDADKLDLQQQEIAALEAFHVAFNTYKDASDKYLETIQAGRPDDDLADEAINTLQYARTSLQTLLDINNSYADFSNVLAQEAFRKALLNGSIVLIIGLVLGLFMSYLVVLSITSRLSILTHSVTALQEGKLDQVVDISGRDEVTILGKAFNVMAAQLKNLFNTLEQRVAERTQSLELASEVGRTVSQVRSLDVMLKDAAELIRSRFGLYYTQIYLTNPAQNALILQTGTGNVGAELISRNHQLLLNTGSINGRAVVEKRSVVISDTTASTTFRPNPLLPETRSEMAVPLMIGEKVVGVLDLQSSKASSLSQDILPAFEALAGQLAIAIQNANLLAEAEQARAEVENQARNLTRTNWKEYLDAIHEAEYTGFVFKGNQITPLENTDESLHLVEEGNALSAPIAVSGEQLGTLVVELDAQNQSAQNTELIGIVARQVAQQIESLRLLGNAERYRFEAEQAARRTTIEGWQQYIASRNTDSLGYLYDSKEVRPYNEDQPMEETAFTLPIKAHEETVGKLSVMGLGSQDGEALELANAVVERLGAHIENLRLYEETKRGEIELNKRARQLASVAEVSSVSSRELDIDKMLHSVVHLTQRQFGLYHAHVFIYDEDTAELKIAACGYKEGDPHEGTDGTAVIPLAKEQSLVARSARTRQAVIVNDVRNEPGWLPNSLLPDTASEMAVPLNIGDQILGVLDVQSDRINAFSEEDANIYSTLASQVSSALQNAKSFSKSQQQAERESMLNTISQKIQSATTVEAVLQIAARELGHALGAPLTIAQLGMKDHNN